MIREDIYEPLFRYRDEFREKFERLAIEKFEKLLVESGVDEKKNRRLIREILRLKAEKDAAASRHRFYVFLNTLFIALIIVSVIALFLELSQNWLLAAILTASFSAVLFFVWSLPESRSAAAYVEKMEKLIRQKTGEAWEQLRPLNRLYHWRITAELIEATVPRIQFDPYFTLKRLTDLKESFGWDDEYNSDKSVCFSHSGVINDNPFVLGSLKKFDWQKKTYEGYLEIHWTTVERDANGNRRTVHHSQTLYATVEKPIPVYSNEKLLIYGNDAAPELTFSRKPSKHSAAGDGFFASMSKKRELNRLKKLARNLEDDSDYTMMSNQEFELLFHSTDRSDEVQFRLLFTPLAQQQMVRLLKDQEVGFGDDFYFQKLEKINVVWADHLDRMDLSDDPSQFRHFSVDEARKNFLEYNAAFFKNAYFVLAPLLTIPLYQQTRSRESIYGDLATRRSSFWEYEAIANHYGGAAFQHQACVTDSILKATHAKFLKNGSTEVTIKAHGFRTEKRVEYVKVFGRDGKYHPVPVYWDEYLPVQKESQILVMEKAEPEDNEGRKQVNAVVSGWKDRYEDLICRRSVYACRK